MQPYRVLLVDDEEDIRVGISRKMGRQKTDRKPLNWRNSSARMLF